MRDIKSNLLSKGTQYIFIILALFSLQLLGQVDIETYQTKFGDGIIALKKKINVSFVFNETQKQYFAKVSYKYEVLHLGEDEATKGLEQIAFNPSQKLNIEKARYYKLDSIGNKRLIENVKVKYADVKDYYINNIFYSDLKVKQFNCSVDLPEDYIVNYSYSLTYKDLKFLTTLYFQGIDEAVEEVEISIKKNPNVQFSVFEFNLRDIKKTEDASYIRFKAKNLQRFTPVSTSAKGSYFLPHLIISVAEVTNKKEKTTVLKSTEDLYNWYSSLIGQLKPNKEKIKNLAVSILNGETDPSNKIEKIFKWVQNNVQYVAFENGIAGFKPTESNKVASLKYGDCKGMANLLVDLLKSVGFDAKHTWIGTRANNYSYDIPSLAVDNHMICALNYNNKLYFLDATSKNASWDVAPAHLEGKQAMVAQGDSYSIETIPISSALKNQLIINGSIDVGKEIPTINLEIKANGNFYRDFKSSEVYTSVRNKKNIPYYFLSPYLEGIKIDEISAGQGDKEQVIFKVSGKYKNVAFGDKKIVFPFLNLLVYPKLLKKTPPIYFDYQTDITSKIEIVNGAKFPSETYNFETDTNERFNAAFNARKINGKYYVEQHISLKALNTSIEEYRSWNLFYDQINSFNNLFITYD